MESLPKVRGAGLAFAALAVLTALALQGCGGGGGGGGGSSATGALLAVSFIGFQPSPGSPFVPFVFRDQALEFTFDGPSTRESSAASSRRAASASSSAVFRRPDRRRHPVLRLRRSGGARRTRCRSGRTTTGGPPLASYVVGRHRDKPDTIVIDPRVPAGNPLGLPVEPRLQLEHAVRLHHPCRRTGFRSAAALRAQPLGPERARASDPDPAVHDAAGAERRSSRPGISFGPDPVPPDRPLDRLAERRGRHGRRSRFRGRSDRRDVLEARHAASIDSAQELHRPQPRPHEHDVPGRHPRSRLGPSADARARPRTSSFIFTPAAPYGPGHVADRRVRHRGPHRELRAAELGGSADPRAPDGPDRDAARRSRTR